MNLIPPPSFSKILISEKFLFCISFCFARVTPTNFLVTRFMCSCSLFLRCRSFSLWWPLTFPLFITAVICKIVMFFFQRNWSPCCLPLTLALFLLSTSMKTLRLSRSKQSALLLLFLSLKVREAKRFTVKTRGYLKCKCHLGLHDGVDGPTDDFLRTKVSWMHSLPNYLTHGALLRELRARESSAISETLIRYRESHLLVWRKILIIMEIPTFLRL